MRGSAAERRERPQHTASARTPTAAPEQSVRGPSTRLWRTRVRGWRSLTIRSAIGAAPRSAARPAPPRCIIDGLASPAPRDLDKICERVRRLLEKQNTSPHGPRRRPCGVRVRCARHARTEARTVSRSCYYTSVRSVVAPQLPRLQLFNEAHAHVRSPAAPAPPGISERMAKRTYNFCLTDVRLNASSFP